MKKTKLATPTPTTRVAIYTRQSVATDLQFGSIDAQREGIEAYVTSQRGAGWVALPARYDDHGFSGGNTERPAFQRMVADIETGKVDVIAAYKIDRVSRSLTDFTQFMSTLERHGVGFVSTTQSFDTRTSMGRLTLNILASFSQFEREVISERTRDKIAATRKKGMWTGGRPILGYDVVDKRLVVNTAEADLVRQINALYLEHGGLVSTVTELERRGIRNKSWRNKRGAMVHGPAFSKNSLRALLTNVLYTGRIKCGDDVVDGQQDAIVDQETFAEAAKALREHRRSSRGPGKWHAVLCGILKCRCGSAMTLSTNQREGRTYRYYVCTTSQRQGAAACPGGRAPAGELEDVVTSRIRTIGQDPSVLLATVAAAHKQRREQEPELIAESRRIGNEKSVLASQRRNLIDAIQSGGPATATLTSRLGEVDEQLERLQQRHHEVTTQLAAIANDTTDEGELRTALTEFTPLWDELTPRERARVLHLLIDEVRFDGQTSELEIRFRDNGIRALARETRERKGA